MSNKVIQVHVFAKNHVSNSGLDYLYHADSLEEAIKLVDSFCILNNTGMAFAYVCDSYEHDSPNWDGFSLPCGYVIYKRAGKKVAGIIVPIG